MNDWSVTNRCCGIAALVLLTLAGVTHAAHQQDRQTSTQARVKVKERSLTSQTEDIIVEGYRAQPGVRSRTVPPTQTSAVNNRTTYAFSERLAKCAARSRLANYGLLRAVIDGDFYSGRHSAAQDRLKRVYITCSESPNLLSYQSIPKLVSEPALFSGGSPSDNSNMASVPDPAPLGHSMYDRGALTIAVLKRFVPDLRLTEAQTSDPTVQMRFNALESKRNRFRPSHDYRTFEIAVCMVRVAPNLAVRLAMSNGQAYQSDLQAALIDRARICVGDAKVVQVDPTQFRIYIADAVYRWAVAVRDVPSLIPNARD